MRDLLVELLCAASRDQLPRLDYLTQGKLHPDFARLKLGLAEHLARRAVAMAAERPETKVAALADLLPRTTPVEARCLVRTTAQSGSL